MWAMFAPENATECGFQPQFSGCGVKSSKCHPEVQAERYGSVAGCGSASGRARGPSGHIGIDAGTEWRTGQRTENLDVAARGGDHQARQRLGLASRGQQQPRRSGGVEFRHDPVGLKISVGKPADMGLGIDLLQCRHAKRMSRRRSAGRRSGRNAGRQNHRRGNGRNSCAQYARNGAQTASAPCCHHLLRPPASCTEQAWRSHSMICRRANMIHRTALICGASGLIGDDCRL